jgi:hypothetical protein
MSLAYLSSFLGATVEGVGIIDFVVFILAACLILVIQSGLLLIFSRMPAWVTLLNQGNEGVCSGRVTVACYLILITVTWYLAFLLSVGYLPTTGVVEKNLPLVLFCYFLGLFLLPTITRLTVRNRGRYIIGVAGVSLTQALLSAAILYLVTGLEDISKKVFLIQFIFAFLLNLPYKMLATVDRAVFDSTNFPNKNSAKIRMSPSAILCLFFILLNGYFFTNTAIDTSARIGFSAIQLFFAACFLTGFGSSSLRKIGVIVPAVFLLSGVGQFSFFHITSSTDSARVAKQQPWSDVKLTDGRNLYVLFFDALVNRRALEKTFNFYEYNYLDKLASIGFREVKGVISASDDSNPTFVRVLTGHDSSNASWAAGKYISGFYDTTVYDVLRRNGIRIQVLMPGRDHGENSNRLNYFFPEARGIRSCDRASSSFIYGLCSKKVAFLLDKIFGLVSAATPFELISKIIARVEYTKKSSHQWLTLAYIWLPGHGDRLADPYHAESFKRGFRMQSPLVINEIERLVQGIRDLDPDPVIVIMGDHGSLIFNEGILGKPNEVEGRPYDSIDLTLDHWGIALSVFPKSFCREQLVDGMTTFNLFPKIFSCMSDSPEKIRSWSQGIPRDTEAAMKILN